MGQFNIMLDEADHRALKAEAAKDGVPLNRFIVTALKAKLEARTGERAARLRALEIKSYGSEAAYEASVRAHEAKLAKEARAAARKK